MDDRQPPKVENAPGLVWKARKEEWVATWQPRTDLVKRGFPADIHQIWRGNEPTELDRQMIADQCTRYQDEMLVWGRGGIQNASAIFDGSIYSLIECFKTDPDSPFKKKRYVTRQNYTALCRRIEADHGETMVRDIDSRMMLRWHKKWCEDSGIPMAHSLVTMLRSLSKYGRLLLKDAACKAFKEVLSDMTFENPKATKGEVTAEQAAAIIVTAHKCGLHSIALAQAFQFVCQFRQKDVIGEWVPLDEEGLSDVFAYGGPDKEKKKWLRGIRWEEIDKNFILRHSTSKRGKVAEKDLKLDPMIMDELRFVEQYLGAIPTSGPVIISEMTARPWKDNAFRVHWRKIATMVGVPKSVKNMHSRHGGITEADASGADLDAIRESATHSNVKTTLGYINSQRRKSDAVMQARVAYREQRQNKKPETQ